MNNCASLHKGYLSKLFLLILFISLYGHSSLSNRNEEDISTKVKELAEKGNFVEAISLLKGRLRELYKDSTKNALNIAVSENNLANIFMNIGEYDSAEYFFNRVFPVFINSPDARKGDLGILVNNLSIVYQAKGEYQKGLDIIDNGILKVEENSPIFGMLMLSKASLQHNLELNDSSIATYKNCLRLMIPQYGERHLNIGIVYNNLGEVYFSKKEYDNAKRMYTTALHIFGAYWAKNDPNFSGIYNNLGKTEHRLSNLSKAEEYLQLALKLKLSRYKPDNPDFLETYENLSELYTALNKHAESKKFRSLAEEIRKKKDISGTTGTILNKKLNDK